MLDGKRIVVVMPAYNAEQTLERTVREAMASGVVDAILVVDDASQDRTVAVARELPGVRVVVHPENRGYGANQKTCYREALAMGADVVIMLHPDYQYSPKLIPAMASLIANGAYPCVIGSRILGGKALCNGMPLWRYVSNRVLTMIANLAMGAKLSEYHTGYRAFSRDLLASLDLSVNADDFVFDNQMLAQVIWAGHTVAEITCPTRYSPESSSINFRRSVRYGIGCVVVALTYFLCYWGLLRHPRFPRTSRRR